jgi:virulence-associated protein VagC
MGEQRRVKLFRNGRNQAVRIPGPEAEPSLAARDPRLPLEPQFASRRIHDWRCVQARAQIAGSPAAKREISQNCLVGFLVAPKRRVKQAV